MMYPPRVAYGFDAQPVHQAKMTPAKVFIGDGGVVPGFASVQSASDASWTSMPYSSGEWVKAVMQTAPHLDQQGIHQALSILDRALSNVQHAKALENLIASSQQMPYSTTNVVATELMRAQVCEQQQMLRQLHLLRARAVASQVSAASVAGTAAGLCMPSVGACAGLGFDSAYGALAAAAAAASSAQQFAHSSAINDLVLGALMAQELLPQALPILPTLPRGVVVQGEVVSNEQPVLRPYNARHVPEPKAAARAPRQVQTLSTSLQLLSKENPDVLIIVRRINKLGFKAARKLKQYFQQFGTVTRVLVAHSTCRQQGGESQVNARRRPSSLGFIHMTSADAVRQVLALGSEQEVDGALIRVQKFERQHGEAAAAEALADEEAEEAAAAAEEEKLKDVWGRQGSANSNASTSSIVALSTTSSASTD